MPQKALVLGPTGRFGRHMVQALTAAGWQVTGFDRTRDDLIGAARGQNLIVNGWNPPYPRWQAELPGQIAQIIAAARTHGATILQPGNVYVYGAGAPALFGPGTPHAASNPLGRLRIRIEHDLKASGLPVIVLRGGDFIDTRPGGNWFERVIVPGVAKGRFTWLGQRMDADHAWAFLPDFARAAVELVQAADGQGGYREVLFPGFTLTGEDLARALEAASGQSLARRHFPWAPVRLAAPFWPMGRHILEMRYLWDKPHRLDGDAFRAQFPDFRPVPVSEAMRQAIAWAV